MLWSPQNSRKKSLPSNLPQGKPSLDGHGFACEAGPCSMTWPPKELLAVDNDSDLELFFVSHTRTFVQPITDEKLSIVMVYGVTTELRVC